MRYSCPEEKESPMYIGPWVRVIKPPEFMLRTPDGRIRGTQVHDDEPAQNVGFRAGIVGGMTMLEVTAGAVESSFGDKWYEGGIYSVRHKTPVYEGDVRVTWEEVEPDQCDARKITFYVEDRQGMKSTYGWASLSKHGQELVPPWERFPAHSNHPVIDDALPEMQVGTVELDCKACFSEDDITLYREFLCSESTWWHSIASPWGKPILSPGQLTVKLWELITDLVKRTPRLRTVMDAGTDIVVYGPMFIGQMYRIRIRIIDKWQTKNTVFWTDEYTIDDDSGKRLALLHWPQAHFIRDLKPY